MKTPEGCPCNPWFRQYKKMRRITLTSILFIVLFAAALFCGCYSGKYEEEIIPIDPCDPDVPVVLNGDTIPEERIWRNASGCVIKIDLSNMSISDSNCLAGIEVWSRNLERLIIHWNDLTSINLSLLALCANLEWLDLSCNRLTNIDLTPLSSCMNLWYLDIYYNNLTSIDLTSLWDLDSLEYLFLHRNYLDSTSCAHVCDFIDEHPDCDVWTDCDCGGKSERNTGLNIRDTETNMRNTDIHIRNTEAGERNTGINQTIADTDMRNTGVSVKYTEVDE